MGRMCIVGIRRVMGIAFFYNKEDEVEEVREEDEGGKRMQPALD
jgi:hypothetical protein